MPQLTHFNDHTAIRKYDALRTPIWVFDVERHGMWWANKSALKFWDAGSLEELVSRDYSGDSETVRLRLRQIVETTLDGDSVMETWTLYPKGHPTTVVLDMKPVTIEQDIPAILIEATAPIDLRREPEALRILEAARYTPLMVSIFSLEGELLAQNPAASVAYNLPQDGQAGTSSALGQRFIKPQAVDALVKSCRRGHRHSGDFRVRTSKGKRWHHLDARPAQDPMTGDRSIVITEEDISSRKRAERQLESLNQTLERRVQERTHELDTARLAAIQANHAKSDFLATMSHELRTPLNAIIGFTDLLLNGVYGELNGRQSEILEDIGASGNHLFNLISDLLDASRIEAGRLELKETQVNLNAILEECTTALEPACKGKNVNITRQGLDASTELYADHTRLKQILLNLISNAVKFTPGGGTVKLQVELNAHRDYLILSITDTGIGVPEEMIPALFEPFSQASPDHSSLQRGAGLGLYIAKSLVQLHDGDISFQSRVGEGSCVTVSLPQARLIAS
ncbi:PAS domain-containing sensor histidine kinase [Pelagibius sp. Alg239-R121]|uniref:PAS domain-containing sensor histidine kinase n=1 Tax=Pelagibius sp. Alg239-R121 TaxID=2993448 RepID=UPI0024A75E65|nr:PAS domain-containing sensor histidine kinase [Pelagibius sp. Alg239-R121]